MNMQASLFSPAIDFKEQALLHFSRFEVRQALACLEKAKSIDPYLADLDWLINLGELEQGFGAQARMSAAQTARLWRAGDELWKAGKIEVVAINLLRTHIAQRLLAGKFTPAGFCSPEEKNLHCGICHLVLRNWQAAFQNLLHLVTEHQELTLPVHWAYFADAAYALRRWPEASLGYARALLAEPEAVDELTLMHAGLRGILQRLRFKGGNEKLARALWPFESWRQEVLEVPRGRTFLFSDLQHRRSVLGSELMLEREQRLRQFCLCLYVDQANLHDQINFDARAEMKALEPHLFTEYLAEVTRRRR
ncbi:MAG: hypothetical protein ACREOO_20205 [bacterium]